MSNDTKATISIFVVICFFLIGFAVYTYADFMVKKNESLIESFNNNEEIYCSKDNNWTLVNKSSDWKLVGYHFIKGNIDYDLIENCEKNHKLGVRK